MIDYSLLMAVFAGVVLLIVLILRFKIQAFIALLLSSILVGVLSGMEPLSIIKTIQQGMGRICCCSCWFGSHLWSNS